MTYKVRPLWKHAQEVLNEKERDTIWSLKNHLRELRQLQGLPEAAALWTPQALADFLSCRVYRVEVEFCRDDLVFAECFSQLNCIWLSRIVRRVQEVSSGRLGIRVHLYAPPSIIAPEFLDALQDELALLFP